MSTSRKRNNFAIAGRLTAVTLSVALLAGCTGARFMMGGDPAPVTPTGVAPVAPSQAAGLVDIKGKATLAGVPLANATVKVFDALTNAPAAVIAAGGANVVAAGGGNYGVLQTKKRLPLQVAGASFTTDAQGNFSLPLGNFKPGMAARIVVTAGGKTVTTMITGSGKAIKTKKTGKYAVQTVVFENADLNEATHAGTQLLYGTGKMLGSLSPESADAILDKSMDTLNDKMMDQIEEKVANGDASLFADTDETGRVKDTKAFDTFVKDAGLDDETNEIVNSTRESVAKESANPDNVVQGVSLNSDDFAGSDMSVTFENGTLTFKNEETGETFTVTLPAGEDNEPGTNEPNQPGTNEPEPTTEDTSAGSEDDAANDISDAGAFNPTVSSAFATGTLSVTVSQPAGTDDVAAIFARIPVTGNTLNTALFTGDIGTGTVTMGATTVNLVLKKNNAAASSVTLPPRFASATISGAVWAGYLETTGGTKIASFQVFTVGSFHYLVTKYNLTDSVTTNGGHTTTLTTTALSSIATGAEAEITLVSRDDNYVNTVDAL